MADTMDSLRSIELEITHEFKDKEFREAFFDEVSRQEIAEQIRSLRLFREKKQTDFEELCDMKQSAISRLENPDYGRWNYQTLSRVAAALDARIKVELIPAELAVREFVDENPKETEDPDNSIDAARRESASEAIRRSSEQGNLIPQHRELKENPQKISDLHKRVEPSKLQSA